MTACQISLDLSKLKLSFLLNSVELLFFLMSKAWAQNKEGDFAWEFGPSSASAIRKAIKKCNEVSKKNKSSCEVKSVNEYNILISQTNDPRLIKRLGGDTKVAKKKTLNKKISTNAAEKYYIDIEFNVSSASNSSVRLAGKSSKTLITFEDWKKRRTYFNDSGLCYTPKYRTVNYFHTVDSCMNATNAHSYNLKFYNNPKDKTYTFEYWGNKKVVSADWNSRTSPTKKKVKVAKTENNSGKDPDKSNQWGHRADLPYYCSTADFTELFSQKWYCNQKKYYTKHTKQYAPIIKLNKEIYYSMKSVEKKVVSELKRKKEITGKDQSLLFYDLLYAKRKVIYDNLKYQLKSETKIAKTEEPKKKIKVAKTEEPKKKIKKTTKQNDNNFVLFSKKDNLNFDKSKEIWHAVIVHKGENDNSEINIYRSDINSKINTKAKAIKNAKQKCWFDPIYDMSDWPSINCVMYYVANNKDFSKRYKIDKKLEQQIIKKKLSEEIELIKNSSKIEDSGLSVKFLGLEKETYDLALKKEQDRREELYAEACTGIIFGHKKGTQKWYECLIEKEQEDKEKGITTKVVKKEEKKKQNKKVVKKQEASQEEFTPKKTNQDNEPPIIKISNSFTVNDANYEISGTVTDESKRIFIEVDGQTIQAKKGKFTIKRYSPIDEQIQIVAIDNWGNKSEPQIVDIIIDTKVTLVTDNIEPLNPNKIRARSNSNKVALIIGIEEYKQTPAASYANLDAKFFYEYARKGFGVSKNNIKILIDEDANLISSLGTLKKWLPGKIKSNQTELIVFFAGHGLASSNGEELYLLPQDSDPDLLERTALSRNELFETIIRLNPKNVTMFFDTCFSGISRDEKTLLASARPIRIIASEEEDIPNNFTIFSASQLDQISSGIKEAKHGIFSYYLMKGLEGYADVNKDKKITNGELLAYMDENVSQKASELGRQQNPSLAGDPNKVLMSYR